MAVRAGESVVTRRSRQWDRIFNVVLLFIIFLVVHTIYTLEVKPTAEAWTKKQSALVEADPSYRPARHLYVIIRDPEPEAAIIMTIWALVLSVQQGYAIRRQRTLLDADLMPLQPGACILPGDVREHLRRLEVLPARMRDSVVPRVLRMTLQRFGATGNVQDASLTVHQVCETEAVRLDSELAMVRFGIWSIPAIGFVGTVRGLGEALQSAQFALANNDPAALTEGLGVSFNSTFVALTLSIVVMYVLHELQLAQDQFVLDTEQYADERLVNNLKATP